MQIAIQLHRFLQSETAARILSGTRTDPLDALGDVFLRLHKAYHTDIRDLEKWVAVNSQFYLRNWRREETRHRLIQFSETEHEHGG